MNINMPKKNLACNVKNKIFLSFQTPITGAVALLFAPLKRDIPRKCHSIQENKISLILTSSPNVSCALH